MVLNTERKTQMKIKIKLDEGATMPTRAHDTDVGYDIRALSVEPSEGRTLYITGYKNEIARGSHNFSYITFNNYVVVHTGVHIQPEPGYYAELIPNSRWGKRSYICYSPGIIDPGYTGEIIAIFKPHPWDEVEDSINPGDVVGQLIIRKKYDAEFEVTDKLDETDRGEGGFGSTACLA